MLRHNLLSVALLLAACGSSSVTPPPPYTEPPHDMAHVHYAACAPQQLPTDFNTMYRQLAMNGVKCDSAENIYRIEMQMCNESVGLGIPRPGTQITYIEVRIIDLYNPLGLKQTYVYSGNSFVAGKAMQKAGALCTTYLGPQTWSCTKYVEMLSAWCLNYAP